MVGGWAGGLGVLTVGNPLPLNKERLSVLLLSNTSDRRLAVVGIELYVWPICGGMCIGECWEL